MAIEETKIAPITPDAVIPKDAADRIVARINETLTRLSNLGQPLFVLRILTSCHGRAAEKEALEAFRRAGWSIEEMEAREGWGHLFDRPRQEEDEEEVTQVISPTWERFGSGETLKAVEFVSISGLFMHLTAVRVTCELGCQTAYYDPDGFYEKLVEMDPDGAFETVEIKGYEGQWTIFATPYQD